LFEPHFEFFDPTGKKFPICGEAESRIAPLTPQVGEQQVLSNGHIRRCSLIRILKNPRDKPGPVKIFPCRHIMTGKSDSAAIRQNGSCGNIEKSRLAGAVRANDRDKLAILYGKTHVTERIHFIDSTAIESFMNFRKLYHKTALIFLISLKL
jgi:hypothetical protein